MLYMLRLIIDHESLLKIWVPGARLGSGIRPKKN